MSENYEPGRYAVRVINQGFGVEAKGTEFFYLGFRPMKRVYDDYDEDCHNLGDRELKLHLTEKTIDFQVANLRNLGWGGTDFEELFSGSHSFVGQDIEVSCEHQEFRGRYYERWSLWGEGRKAASNSTILSLNQKFGEKLKETAIDLPKRTATIEPEGPDGIPF